MLITSLPKFWLYYFILSKGHLFPFGDFFNVLSHECEKDPKI